jgi:hypothetical protein
MVYFAKVSFILIAVVEASKNLSCLEDYRQKMKAKSKIKDNYI